MSIFISILWGAISLSPPAFSRDQAAHKTPTYLSYDLEYSAYEAKRLQLEKKLGHALKNRGEAHITLVSPPEFARLISHGLSARELEAEKKLFLQSNPVVNEICIGEGSLKKNNEILKTYYVVVEVSGLTAFRQKLAKRAGISPTDFDPNLVYPHVTLGFTSRDLHFEDGLVKDQSSCRKN